MDLAPAVARVLAAELASAAVGRESAVVQVLELDLAEVLEPELAEARALALAELEPAAGQKHPVSG